MLAGSNGMPAPSDKRITLIGLVFNTVGVVNLYIYSSEEKVIAPEASCIYATPEFPTVKPLATFKLIHPRSTVLTLPFKLVESALAAPSKKYIVDVFAYVGMARIVTGKETMNRNIVDALHVAIPMVVCDAPVFRYTKQYR